MGRALMQRLQQTRPMGSLVEEAGVNLLLAAAWYEDLVDKALAEVGVTHAQYNVLRILRGAQPLGLPRCEVACRMIDRAPDVTRLIDRLEARRLVERGRDPGDARRSLTRITRAGLAALEKGTAAIEAVNRGLSDRLRPAEFRELSRLCEALYGAELGNT